MDLTKHSVLAVCGGDGSLHEVVNGMLDRDDGLKLPLAFLPGGSGNDVCSNLGITSLEVALNNIVSHQCIKIDTVRVLLDHESEETLPEGLDRLNYCRHMILNTALAVPAVINNGAIPFKGCCGGFAYEISTLWQACKGNFRPHEFEMTIDD